MPYFTPDYRDVIMFNGTDTYKATGEFQGTRMVMEDKIGNRIKFNVNVDFDVYMNTHQDFEIFREKDSDNFLGSEIYLQ